MRVLKNANEDMTLSRIEAIGGLAFGSILINTLPAWLEELTARFALSANDAGLLATLVLLSAGAACWGHSAFRHWSIDLGAALLVVLVLLLGRAMTDLPTALVFGACMVFGLAVGVVLGRSIAFAFGEPDTLRTISLSLTAALLVSLVIVLVSAQTDLTAVTQIAMCAALNAGVLSLTVWRSPVATGPATGANWMPDRHSLRFLPFFAAMGGFWAFVELYGNAHAIPHVKLVLAASYLASAAGSALVFFISTDKIAFWRVCSLAISAVSAALVYSTASTVIFSAMFLLNSLFLFVFLPLYLTGNTEDGAPSNPQAKIALYLFGFALGGAITGVLIAQFGYLAFAGLIMLSILPACAGVRAR